MLSHDESSVIEGLWRLSNRHGKDIELRSLQYKLAMPDDSFRKAVTSLAQKMILLVKGSKLGSRVSFTPLGIAILRSLLHRDLEVLISDHSS